MNKIYLSLKSGFTLLETTIVVGIASLLLTISSNLFVFSKQAARDVVRKTDIDQIRAALEFYREDDSNKYYAATLSALLVSNGGYIDKIPKDPLSTSYNYCYSIDSDPTNYILGAKLERGGPSSCTCNSLSYNYCYSPLGLLITPTPTIAQPTQSPTNTPVVPTSIPTSTPTPVIPTSTPTPVIPTATPTPTSGPDLVCNQIGSAYYDAARQKYVVTLGSNYSDSTWTIVNNLNCTPLAGSGSIFGTRCVNLGTSIATVSYGGLQNTCPFSTNP